MYYDFTNIDHKKSVASKPVRQRYSFDIKRFYVGIDHKFNDIFSANVTTDFTYDSGAGATQVYIKKAYLRSQSGADARHPPGLDRPAVGSLRRRRLWLSLCRKHADRPHAISAPRPTGASMLKGKLANGIIEYAVSAVNGAGYKKTYRTKGVDVEGRVSAHFQRHHRWRSAAIPASSALKQGTTTYHTANRFDALAAYTGQGDPRRRRILPGHQLEQRHLGRQATIPTATRCSLPTSSSRNGACSAAMTG